MLDRLVKKYGVLGWLTTMQTRYFGRAGTGIAITSGMNKIAVIRCDIAPLRPVRRRDDMTGMEYLAAQRLGNRRTGLAHWSVEPGSGSRPQRTVADDPAAPRKALLKEEPA